jgi:hypothetical protein
MLLKSVRDWRQIENGGMSAKGAGEAKYVELVVLMKRPRKHDIEYPPADRGATAAGPNSRMFAAHAFGGAMSGSLDPVASTIVAVANKSTEPCDRTFMTRPRSKR